MNSGPLLPLGLVVPVLFTLLTSIALALAYPLLRKWLARITPASRRTFTLTIAFGPLVASIALTAIAFSPSLVTLIWPSLDHCLSHAANHPHLCLVHPASTGAGKAGWLLVGVATGAALLLVVQQTRRLLVGSGLVRRLARFARHHQPSGAFVFGADLPLALTAGFTNTVYLSTGMLAFLSEEQLAVVLAHERHHATVHDPFWASAAALVSVLHWPQTRTHIMRDLHLACEQACDEAAAKAMNNRPLVARTILDVNKRLATHPWIASPAVKGFAEHHVVARVESLLQGQPFVPAPKVAWWLYLALAIVVVALATPVHHASETLVSLVAQ